MFFYTLLHAGELTLDYPGYSLLVESGKHLDSLDRGEINSLQQEKSVFRAGLYSIILPGTGELYARSYWRAAVFFGLEVASWTFYGIYTGKGNRANSDMELYANTHWSEQKYWTKVYELAYENLPESDLPDLPLLDTDGDHLIDDKYYTPYYINILRGLEGELGGIQGLGFTHRLPGSHTQQYYEMIYKYPEQFGNGWDDARWEEVYSGFENKLSSNMRTYRDMRNEMNDLYKTAETALNVVVINHVLSAIDAALTARRFNRTFTVRLRSELRQVAYQPVQLYGIQINW